MSSREEKRAAKRKESVDWRSQLEKIRYDDPVGMHGGLAPAFSKICALQNEEIIRNQEKMFALLESLAKGQPTQVASRLGSKFLDK